MYSNESDIEIAKFMGEPWSLAGFPNGEPEWGELMPVVDKIKRIHIPMPQASGMTIPDYRLVNAKYLVTSQKITADIRKCYSYVAKFAKLYNENS